MGGDEKLLGIDYGTKKVGIALSDDTGTIAFPKRVLVNDDTLVGRIKDVVVNEGVTGIVIGESTNLTGKDNPLMEHIHSFKKMLEETVTCPVYFEPEFFTTKGAEKVQEIKEKTDASAAALILQSFLDKMKDNGKYNNN